MQRNAFDAKANASLLEFCGAITGANRLKVRKQRAGDRKAAQDCFDVLAKMNHGEATGFLPRVSDGLIGPVNVLGFKVSNVTLRAAEMPAQLIKVAPFRVLFPSDHQLVFLKGDGAFWLEPNFRPETFGNERP